MTHSDFHDHELDDCDELGSPRTILSRLTSSAALRAIGSIVIALAILIWPDRSTLVLARLVGVAVVWLSLAAIGDALFAGRRQWVRAASGLVSLGVGVALLVFPSTSAVTLGRIVGVIVVAYAAFGIATSLRAKHRPPGRVATFALFALVGVGLVAFTQELFGVVMTVGVLGWLAFAAITLSVALNPATPDEATHRTSLSLVAEWLRERPKSADARQTLYDKILFEGPEAGAKAGRFFILMSFSTIIAAMGVITDSTAIVIGAMLIAPLMTPLMGMAISLVMGWPNRLARASLLAFGGIACAIGISILLGLMLPTAIDTSTNAQILARTSPTMLDLITAVAAGAVGAYGLSRPDVSDSLPGVAIAISLVPPLAVVGLCYSAADFTRGNGALLLFATNMVAILVVGGITFVLTGVTPLSRVTEGQQRVATGLAVTFASAILVTFALLLNGSQHAADLFLRSQVEQSVEGWLPGDNDYRVQRISLHDQQIDVSVVGPSAGLPDVQELADELARQLGRPVDVKVSLVVEEVHRTRSR